MISSYLYLYLLMFGGFLMVSGGISTVLMYRRWGMPVMSEDEKRIAALRKEREREENHRLKLIRNTARHLQKVIVSTLVGMGFAYVYERKGAVASMSKPEIGVILYSKDAIYYKIEKLPFRKAFTELLDPDVERNLSLAVGRTCKFIADPELGVFLQVELKAGISGIPRFFPYLADDTAQNAFELLPKSKPWAVPIGLTTNRRFVYYDARKFPHLLVAGATGGGKSVFLNQMLCTLIRNNSPSTLKVLLIDLKGGLEFDVYHDIPHIYDDVIINREDVPGALQKIQREKERRFAMFRGDSKDIDGWNHTHRMKLPRIFIIFDEIANMMLDPKIKGQVDTLINDLAAQGRALGLHLILCTQVPNKAVLTRIILSNITCRIAFNTDLHGSMLILGNGRASDIPPGGRMIFRVSNSLTECQAPFIAESQIHDIVESVKEPEETTELTEHDLFQTALVNFGGFFSYRKLYDHYDGLAGQRWLKDVSKAWRYNYKEKGPVIDLNGDRYILALIPGPGGIASGLVRLPDDLESMPENKGDVYQIVEAARNG